MAAPPLELTRSQILAFRRRARRAASTGFTFTATGRVGEAGPQDTMPGAALLSIHAQVAGAHFSVWEDPSLVQLWGPRFSTYVAPARDRAIFSLGRLPDDARGRPGAVLVAGELVGTWRRAQADLTIQPRAGAGSRAPNAMRSSRKQSHCP